MPNASLPSAHLPTLDGLRGLAAVVVMVSHLSQATGILDGYFQNSGGQIGVMLFFALSGFLMAHVYLDKAIGTAALFRYAVARVSRVVPLFLIIVLAAYVGTKTGWFRAYPIDDSNIVNHLMFRSGESVLWTIPVELRFYGVFCFLWLAYRLSAIGAALFVAAVLVAYYAVPPGGMPVMRLGHFFLVGILCWYAVGRLAPKQARWADVLFIASGFALLLSFPLPFEAFWGRAPQIWWEPQIAVATFVFLSAAVRSPVAAALLGALPMRRLGDWSYSLYLTHMLTFMNLRMLIDPRERPWSFVATAVPLVLAQSAFIRRFVERPSQDALRRIAGGLSEKPVAEKGRATV